MTTGKFDLHYVTVRNTVNQFIQGLFEFKSIIMSDEFVDFATQGGSDVTTPETEATTLSAITKFYDEPLLR